MYKTIRHHILEYKSSSVKSFGKILKEWNQFSSAHVKYNLYFREVEIEVHNIPSYNIQNVPGGKLSTLEVIISVILSKKLHTYMCAIPNGFRDTAISLYTVQTSNTTCPHTSCKVH
jgi:hypothetical protein